MDKEEIRKVLTPKNDLVFKRLFGKIGNERFAKDFLEAVLEVKIESVTLGKETELVPEKIDEKLGILDVLVSLPNGTQINIEMQKMNAGDVEKRFTYYMDRLYVSGLEKGKSYAELNKVIVIGILDFVQYKDLEAYHTIWKQTEQGNKEKTFDEQEIHIIELPKFLKSKLNVDRKLDQWLLFIDYTKKELIELAKKKNDAIKGAAEEVEYLTGDEDLQRIAFLKRKYELDYNSGIDSAREEGREKGRAEGKAEGRKEGREEGKEQEKINMARKMLARNMDVEVIVEITGLSLEEIEKLRNCN